MHSNSTHRSDPVAEFKRPEVDPNLRYVYVHAGASGLGNRILSIVSAFLLALLTDRTLIIFSPHYDFRKVLCTPFPNSTWILPHEVKIPAGKMIDQFSVSFELTDFSNIDAQIIQIRDMETYFLTSFFLNKHLIDKLNQLFPGRNVATVLLRYLIHPSNAIWADILKTFEDRNRYAVTVGLQIRAPVFSAIPAIKCLPDELPNNTHVFVASLGSQIDNIKSVYPNWNVTQRFVDGGEKHDSSQLRTALHDIFVVSMCDKIVISVRSTFGYIIMALKGSLCAIVGNNEHDNGVNKDTCSWPNSHEICNHPGHVLLKQMNDTGSIFYRDDIHPALFTGPCVDFASGIRLNTARD